MATPVDARYAIPSTRGVKAGTFVGGRLAGAPALDSLLAAGSLVSVPSGLLGSSLLDDSAASGSLTGDTTPAWLASMPVGFQWNAIAGTNGPGAGLIADAFGDMTLKPSTSELIVLAQGGHGDGSSNACASIQLAANSPAWVTRFAGSTTTPTGVTYYPDDRPSSRHGYHFTHYVESLDAVLLAGCLYSWGPSDYASGPGMDLFSLATNDYLPRNTWPDIPDAFKGLVLDNGGNVWTQNGRKFNLATKTWGSTGLAWLNRFPAALDTVNNRIFQWQWRDGQGAGELRFYSADLDPVAGTSSEVVVTPSAALTALQADAPSYAAMAFCPLDGKFYFLHPGRMNRFYVFTPNYGGAWSVAIQEIGGALPGFTPGSGSLCKRLHWVPALDGFVVQSSRLENLYFLRMA